MSFCLFVVLCCDLCSRAKPGEAVPSIEQLNTRVNRLKFLLEETMGCPNTFELRRQELALLASASATTASTATSTSSAPAPAPAPASASTSASASAPTPALPSISDEQVLDSFLESLGPGGFHREYLLNAQVTACRALLDVCCCRTLHLLFLSVCCVLCGGVALGCRWEW